MSASDPWALNNTKNDCFGGLKPLVYLACPYWHEDPEVREERYNKVNKISADLALKGLNIYSPITVAHKWRSIDSKFESKGWEDFWKPLDFTFLSLSYKIIVLRLPGWEQSVGVTDEIKYAKENNIVIEYMDYE